MSSSHSVLIVALVAVVALGGMYVMSSAVSNFPVSLHLPFSAQNTLTGAQVVEAVEPVSPSSKVTVEASTKKGKCRAGQYDLDGAKPFGISNKGGLSRTCYNGLDAMPAAVMIMDFANAHPEQCSYSGGNMGGSYEGFLDSSGELTKAFPSDSDCARLGAGAKLVGYAGFQPWFQAGEDDNDGPILYSKSMDLYNGKFFCKHSLDGIFLYNNGIGYGVAVCCSPCSREKTDCENLIARGGTIPKSELNEDGTLTDEANEKYKECLSCNSDGDHEYIDPSDGSLHTLSPEE